MEKQSFSLKLLSGDFYGQSFNKTVRGPLVGPVHVTSTVLPDKSDSGVMFCLQRYRTYNQ